MSEAPWTDAEVMRLNIGQVRGYLHPFTCANRDRDTHPMYPGEPDFGLLVATRDGWICRDCDYTQTWAHGWMVSGSTIGHLAANDDVLDLLVSHGSLAADMVVIGHQGTAAEQTRDAIRRALEMLLGNGLIVATDPDTWPQFVRFNPPYSGPLW